MEIKLSKLGVVNSAFQTFVLKESLVKNDAGDWGEEPKENTLCILRSTNFTNEGKIKLDDVAHRTLKSHKGVEKKLTTDDILIERSGGSDTQPVGRVIFVDELIGNGNYAFANFIQRISFKRDFESKYIYYCLQQMYEAGITSSMQNQTTGIRNLDWKLYTKTILPKPPKLEQKAIATILSKVDEAIETVKQSINATEKLKKAMMQNLLTGKLKPDGTWRKEEEFYIDEKFGKIPKDWIIEKGNKLTIKITKGQSPKWQGFEYQDEGILFVTSENVQNGFIDLKEPKYLPIEFNKKIKNSQLHKGDILVNIVGASIGRCSMFDLDVDLANTNQAVCVFRLNDSNNPDFFSFYFQNESTQRRLLGSQVETARANLSLGDFRKFKFIIPESKNEQIHIANKLNEVKKIITSKHNKIKSLEKLKKSLMQHLLTGKKRLSNEAIKKFNQN
ncbi:restriction endonuclease subunit S [Myroides odoratus]